MYPRFQFLPPPSAGDRLLARASSCKLELTRWAAEPSNDGEAGVLESPPAESTVELRYEIRGELPLKGGDAGDLVAALVHEFRRPQRGEKGGAQ